MTFLSPIWLLGLLPWAALVVWLLRGLREQAHVPFLDLWRGSSPLPKARRAWRPPPPALVLALAGILLALLAAAGPAWHGGTSAGAITIVVDAGVTSAPRYAELLERGDRAVARLGGGPVDLVVVPDLTVHSTDRTAWPALARNLGPSSLDTATPLAAAVSQALARRDAPVLVLSNAALPTGDRRVIHIRAATTVRNVGFMHVSAAHGQVMLTLRNDSPTQQGELRVTTGTHPSRQTIALPPAGAARSCFVDPAELGDVITVQLFVDGDEFPADNRAWLVRRHTPPVIEPQVALPAPLERFVGIYAGNRPARSDATRIAITDDVNTPDRAVIIAPNAQPIARATLTASPHPITRHVDWDALDDLRAAPPPGPAWRPIVRAGDATLLAVRDSPRPQVWIGFDSTALARTPQFVIFWTNVFDWLGSGDESWHSEPVQRLGKQWTRAAEYGEPLGLSPEPGVYARDDGERRAVNLLDVRFPAPPPNGDAEVRLAAVARAASATSLRPAALVGSLCLALGAAVVWPRRPGAR